jgi:hypothetical protein
MVSKDKAELQDIDRQFEELLSPTRGLGHWYAGP